MNSAQLNLPWWDDGQAPSPNAATSQVTAGLGESSSHAEHSLPGGRGAAQLPPVSAPSRPGSQQGLPIFRHPRGEHEIRLGEALVTFELKRVRRRSIGMVVGSDGLSVRAPRWVGLAEIEQALQDKARWICSRLVEQRDRERQQQAARIEWREGATIPVLGEPVILVIDPRLSGVRLHEEAGALPGVARKTLHLGLPQQATAEQIRDTVTAWLQRHARQWFERRVAFFGDELGVAVSRLSLSSARTRWGSASADGSIRLHWRLIHFSPAIIDYVVAHELAHLREMNHSPRFWGVVRSVLPEYDAAREQLRHAVIPE